ncbi:MAG: acetylxylan esterase [Clostridia bacterium]|nr:acetylxylan esterase [Clostridia bacterium]
MIYYIDPMHGCPEADGLSPENARSEYRDLALNPGDQVLFRRGSFIRANLERKPGTAEAPITYGAYGEGENPVFCGSVDVSNPAKWTEIRPNIWKYTESLPSEACNFIYDNGRIGATLRWEEHLLSAQGDWYDSRMGCREQKKTVDEENVLLYSEGNPVEVYSHIECAVWGQRNLSPNVEYTICEDLCFFGSGVHAMAGGSHHITVRRCTFSFIGGAVWNRQLRIRFGNAIEFWEHGDNILIEDCYFNNIYDSCITHQGTTKCKPAENFIMRRNLFVNYGMGAYEGRDKMAVSMEFTDNLCVCAGGGFSGFGDTKPRNSEIYPQPMGHHLFMWRIPEATENGNFLIARNRFYDASGAAMYAIVSPEADAQMHMKDNRYWTTNKTLLNLVGGKSYRPDEFDRYLSEYGEEGAVYVTPDLYAETEAWFAETGCGRYGAKIFTDCLPEPKYFVGSTEKDALSYKIGEEIVFRLTTCPSGVPKFRYVRRGDDGKTDEGIMDSADGTFEYHTSIDCAGYVHLIVTACDENGNPLKDYDVFEGGACAGFDAIRQSGKIPEDFDAFWSRVITEELDPIAPVEIEKKEFHCGDPGDIVYDVKIACPGRNPVSGYLRLPRDAAEKSLPIRVGFLGYGVSSAAIPTKGRAIQLNLNQHGIENGQPIEYYQKMEREVFAGFGFDRDENRNPDTVYFKYMILRALQAIRYCRTLPQWDGVNVTLAGGSMGAFQATSAAALDKDVTRLEIAVPWMCDLRGTESSRLGGWRPAADTGLDYYDTVSMASRVKAETAITAGLGDYVCPPSGVTALYHSFSCKKTLTMMQNKTHPYTAPEYDSYTR